MIKVKFLGPIAHEDMLVDARNLGELREILSTRKELEKWLEISSVALNDKMLSSSDIVLKDGDKISILPPVCGG